jgi:hypothetical protein
MLLPVCVSTFHTPRTHLKLSDAVDAALQRADTYDRQLFEGIRVKSIWLESFDDIAALVDFICIEDLCNPM